MDVVAAVTRAETPQGDGSVSMVRVATTVKDVGAPLPGGGLGHEGRVERDGDTFRIVATASADSGVCRGQQELAALSAVSGPRGEHTEVGIQSADIRSGAGEVPTNGTADARSADKRTDAGGPHATSSTDAEEGAEAVGSFYYDYCTACDMGQTSITAGSAGSAGTSGTPRTSGASGTDKAGTIKPEAPDTSNAGGSNWHMKVSVNEGAAAALMDRCLEYAAANSSAGRRGLTGEKLRHLPQGMARRSLVDDITVVVLTLKGFK
jgi:hypothetical protein